jgi:ubiquitin-conjugating enzyme (huntingtin interacting protein 2)
MADGGGRLGKELLDCQKDKSSGILVVAVGGNSKHLEGTINGPEGTPYEGGVYKVRPPREGVYR